jgi:hypothetical protein
LDNILIKNIKGYYSILDVITQKIFHKKRGLKVQVRSPLFYYFALCDVLY